MSAGNKKKPPLHHRAARKYFYRVKSRGGDPEDAFHIINDSERKEIARVSFKAMALAAAFGIMGVTLLYVPQYLYPGFFRQFERLWIIYGTEIPVNPFTLSYSLFLVLLEIALLTRINIWAVASTANACGFPDKREEHYALHLDQLFNVGMEARNQETLRFGIDPYEGVPRFYIFLFTLWNLVKATLTNFVVKLIVVKIFARVELREYSDLIGIPVFALWNAFATRRIIMNAKVYIMAPGVIHQVVASVSHLRRDQHFRQNLFDAMQYIVSVKRSFHHNHYLLVKKLVEEFDLANFKDEETDRLAFLQKIKKAEPEIKKAYSKLILLGIFIDGSISPREYKALKTLHRDDILVYDYENARHWCKQFRKGRGLDDFADA